MKYILIILILLFSGCGKTEQFYPKGIKGGQAEFFNDVTGKIHCSKCGKHCILFKRSKDKKTIICSHCFDKGVK